MHFNFIRAFVLSALVGSLASAANFSFSGSFAADDSLQLFSFTLNSTSAVTLRTYSYAGGVNSAGIAIPRGGFDPILSLFDSAGVLINENDDGLGHVPTDPITGQPFDSYLVPTLAAGAYTVALTQYDNFANGPNLSNGFFRTGQPNFTGQFEPLCSNSIFCDATGDNRNSNWEFDAQGVASASITNTAPEPAIPTLLGTGILFFAAFRACKRRNKLSC